MGQGLMGTGIGEKNSRPERIGSLSDYTVSIGKNFVQVGCTHISFEEVEIIYKAMKLQRESK